MDIQHTNQSVKEYIREIFESKEFQLAPLYEHEREFGRLTIHPIVIAAGIDQSTILQMYDEAQTSRTSALAVMEYIREIFRSYTFNTWTTEQKSLEINRLASFPMVIRVHITKDDIIQLYDEIIANSVALAKLTKDPLFYILTKCEPKTILNLCQATRNYANLACDRNVFIRLMKLHYTPYTNYPLSKNVRQQYSDIARGNGYVYMINIRHTRDSIPPDFTYLGGLDFGNRAVLLGRFENDDVSQYGDKVNGFPLAEYYEEDNDEIPQMFKLYGNGLEEDTLFWVVICFTSSSTEPWFIGVDKLTLMKQIYNTNIKNYIENAIDNSDDGGGDDITKFWDGILEQSKIDKYAKDYGFPSPFTEENIVEHLDKNNVFWEHPGNDDWGYGLIQVLFPKAP